MHSARFGRAGAEAYIRRQTNLPPQTAFTIMAWVRIRGDGSGFGGGNTPNFFNFTDNANTASYGVLLNDASYTLALWNNSSAATGSTLTSGRWYHIAITVNGTSGNNFLCYLNGVLNITHTAASLATLQSLLFASDLSHEWTDCSISALKIYNRVLTKGEINAEMPFALPVNRGGLNSCYPIPSGWDVLPIGIAYPRSTIKRFADWSGLGNNEFTETGTIDTELGPPILFAPSMYREKQVYKVPTAGAATLLTRLLTGVGV